MGGAERYCSPIDLGGGGENKKDRARARHTACECSLHCPLLLELMLELMLELTDAGTLRRWE